MKYIVLIKVAISGIYVDDYIAWVTYTLRCIIEVEQVFIDLGFFISRVKKHFQIP